MQKFKKLTSIEIKEVFMTYKTPVYNFINSRVRNQHDSEDLFSKSFMKFYGFAQKKEIEMMKIKNLLYTIASNTVNDFFRRKKIIHFFSLDKAVGIDSKTDYYNFFADHNSTKHIDNIDIKNKLKEINLEVSKLPPLQSEAFYLRFMEGFSFNEIAQIQKISLSTALSRVRYAVNKIKNILGDNLEDIL